MKYQESTLGKRSDFANYIKKIVPELFGNRLSIEGQTVAIPSDADLEYKVKYDDDETGGTFTLKVSWDNESEEEAEDIEVDTE